VCLYGTATAQQSTPPKDVGSVLFHSCQQTVRIMDTDSQESSPASDYCVGYFEGMGDVIQFYGSTGLCFKDARVGTIIRVYVAYMEKNPKLLDDWKIGGVIAAMKDSYSCPVKPSP